MRSGRWQARYTVPLGHPSGRGGPVVTARQSFEPNTYGREAAGDWLRAEELRLTMEGASWRTLSEHAEDERIRAAAETVPTFAEYAAIWLRARKVKGQPLQRFSGGDSRGRQGSSRGSPTARVGLSNSASASDGLDSEVVECASGALAEETLTERDADGELRRLGVLVWEGVQETEQAMPDHEAVELAAQVLP